MLLRQYIKRVIFILPLIGTACATQVPVPQIPLVDDRSVLSLAEDDVVERLISSTPVSETHLTLLSPPYVYFPVDDQYLEHTYQ